MNYAELYDAIIAETENNDTTFVANIPMLVKIAEKRIYQAVKLPKLRKNATSQTELGNSYLTMPTDFLSAYEIAVIDSNVYTYLIPKDVSFIREAFPNPTTQGAPKYYAVFDENTMQLAPTPNAILSVEMHYFYYPESIVTAGTTWLGDNFDTLLLYAALVEAAVFMKSEADTMKSYADQYALNMKLLNDYAGGSLRSGPYRK